MNIFTSTEQEKKDPVRHKKDSWRTVKVDTSRSLDTENLNAQEISSLREVFQAVREIDNDPGVPNANFTVTLTDTKMSDENSELVEIYVLEADAGNFHKSTEALRALLGKVSYQHPHADLAMFDNYEQRLDLECEGQVIADGRVLSNADGAWQDPPSSSARTSVLLGPSL